MQEKHCLEAMCAASARHTQLVIALCGDDDHHDDHDHTKSKTNLSLFYAKEDNLDSESMEDSCRAEEQYKLMDIRSLPESVPILVRECVFDVPLKLYSSVSVVVNHGCAMLDRTEF